MKVIYGLSAHSEFGLDTRFAGVIVFEELRNPGFKSPNPPHYADTEAERIKLLNEYNSLGRKWNPAASCLSQKITALI